MSRFSALPMLLDALNDFRLQYFWLSMIGAIAFYFTRRKVALWVSLIILSINAAVVVPWYIPSFQATTNGQPIRILAINVLNKNREYDRVIHWVRHEQPDLVVLSEVIAKWNPWSEALSVLVDEWPYHIRQDDMEIEVYSRWPITVSQEQSYGKSWADSPIIRGFVTLDVEINGHSWVAIATHAFPQTYYGTIGFNLRNQHLNHLGTYVETLSSPVVVAGDLNVTPWSPHYHTMMKQAGLQDARQGFGLLPSQSTFLPQFPLLAIPIDHSFVSPDIHVTDIYTGPNLGSDHLPITTDIVLPSLPN